MSQGNIWKRKMKRYVDYENIIKNYWMRLRDWNNKRRIVKIKKKEESTKRLQEEICKKVEEYLNKGEVKP